MTSARSFAISILGAVLASSSVLCAQQGIEPSEASASVQRQPLIQELELQPHRFVGFSLRADPLSAPLIHAQDLSRYREFQFGMNLPAIAKQAGLEASAAQIIHQRPALIQELKWEPQISPNSSPPADAVKTILFSFYNDQLFRIVVNYDRYKTKGLTDKDMIEALSLKYGTATRPNAKVIVFSSTEVYNDSESVVARWEDSQYSFNLFRSTYQPTFGMLVFSKQLDPLAQTAIAEAIRLDEQGAPQREIERQRMQDAADRADQEKATLENKVAFWP
jgi:hypothetical protein